jgi:hypothetical protein
MARADVTAPGDWTGQCADELDRARLAAVKEHPLFRKLKTIVGPVRPGSDLRVGTYLEILRVSESAKHYANVSTDHHPGALRFYADVYQFDRGVRDYPEDVWIEVGTDDWNEYITRSRGALHGRIAIMFYQRPIDRMAMRLFLKLFRPAIESCLRAR